MPLAHTREIDRSSMPRSELTSTYHKREWIRACWIVWEERCGLGILSSSATPGGRASDWGLHRNAFNVRDIPRPVHVQIITATSLAGVICANTWNLFSTPSHSSSPYVKTCRGSFFCQPRWSSVRKIIRNLHFKKWLLFLIVQVRNTETVFSQLREIYLRVGLYH